MARRNQFPLGRLLSRRQHPLVWVATVLVVLLLYWSGLLQVPQNQPAPGPIEAGFHQVQRVVDGDTIKLTSGHPVRLIGADTPETVKPNHPVEPWGPEATEFTRRFVSGGTVRLEFDGRRVDRYGRVLAHVWVGQQMLEEELVRAGLARAATQYSFSKAAKDRLLAAQGEAKAARRGIWSR